MESALINLLVYIVVVCLILGLVVWAADAIPVPQPFNRIIKVAATIIGVLIVILLLLRLVGITPVPAGAAQARVGACVAPELPPAAATPATGLLWPSCGPSAALPAS